jgi:hypothetical protein
MKVSNVISEELKRMKFLSRYERGVITEDNLQSTPSYHQSLEGLTSFKGNNPNQLPPVTDTDYFKNYPCIKSLKTITASTGGAQGPEKMNVKFKDGGRYHFGSDGSLWSYGQRYGTFKCSTKPNTVILIVGGKETEYPIQGSQTPKVNFTPNEKPPFKFQQKGENIRMMQEYLGMPKNLQTGNFYNRTEQAIKKMFPTYNRSTGVNQDMFDQITGVKQSQQRKTKNTSTIPSERTTQQPQTTVNAAAPTQTATNLVPNAQQTQPTRKQQRQANRLARR